MWPGAGGGGGGERGPGVGESQQLASSSACTTCSVVVARYDPDVRSPRRHRRRRRRRAPRSSRAGCSGKAGSKVRRSNVVRQRCPTPPVIPLIAGPGKYVQSVSFGDGVTSARGDGRRGANFRFWLRGKSNFFRISTLSRFFRQICDKNSTVGVNFYFVIVTELLNRSTFISDFSFTKFMFLCC